MERLVSGWSLLRAHAEGAVRQKIVAGNPLTWGPREGSIQGGELRGRGGNARPGGVRAAEMADAGNGIFPEKPLDTRRRCGILRVCWGWVIGPSRWLFDKWTVVGRESV